jgi:hypothetical protein
MFYKFLGFFNAELMQFLFVVLSYFILWSYQRKKPEFTQKLFYYCLVMTLCFTQLIWLYVNFKMFEGVHDSLKHERKCIRASQFHVTDIYKLFIEYKGPRHTCH